MSRQQDGGHLQDNFFPILTQAPTQEQVVVWGGSYRVSFFCFFPHLMGEQPTNQLRHTGPVGQRDHLLSIFLPGVDGAASQSYRAQGKPRCHQQKFTTVQQIFLKVSREN